MTQLSLALFVFDDTVDATRLLAGLSAEERDRYARFGSRRRAREYLASRWLLRRHLARELNAEPRALAIEYPRGAPPRSADASWQLGLSHSGPACLSLVADGPAGCDIERTRARRFAPEQLAGQYFHPEEAAALGTASSAVRVDDFHRLWTLKEASLKARTRGLAAGMARPSFVLRPQLTCTRAPSAGPWFFGACDIECADGRFALAVATPDAKATIRLTRIRPIGADAAQYRTLTPDWQTTAVHGA